VGVEGRGGKSQIVYWVIGSFSGSFAKRAGDKWIYRCTRKQKQNDYCHNLQQVMKHVSPKIMHSLVDNWIKCRKRLQIINLDVAKTKNEV
jgi:hypothetical protein